MKNRLYLLLIVIVALCVVGWSGYAQGQRSATARQAWEYKTILLTRQSIDDSWSFWFEDDKALPQPVNPTAKRVELGNQGWELVAVVPYADTVGGATTRERTENFD